VVQSKCYFLKQKPFTFILPLIMRTNNFTSKRGQLSNLFLLLLGSAILTYLAYYLISNLAFYPTEGAVGGREVFLKPRYFLAQNDLKSGIFNQWTELFLVTLAAFILVIFSYFKFCIRQISFSKFLFWNFIFAFLMEILFLGLTENGFKHLELQAISINNGILRGVQILMDRPDFVNLGFIDRLQYIFQTIGSNDSGYTIPGTTHPPGIFVIAYFFYAIASLFDNIGLAWGLLLTFINTFLVVVLGLLTRAAFSEKAAKLNGVFLLTIPSLCLHFSAMFDVTASLFAAIGIWALSKVIQKISDSYSWQWAWKWGFIAGLFFTLAVQMTYGHAIPVLASLVSFVLLCRKATSFKAVPWLLGLATTPIIYFIIEYLLSSGHSFWPIRAYNIVHIVNQGLQSRPYPLSQVANWVVMSIMGGLLFLPTALSVLSKKSVSHYISNLLDFLEINNGVIGTKSSAINLSSRSRVRLFISWSAILMIFFLIPNTAVRLEVERTWHWLFVPVWVLMPICFIALRSTIRHLYPSKQTIAKYAILGFLLTQLVISLTLAISIQDYY